MIEVVYCAEMVFSNGCRAPPWRQVLGDIAYIVVSPIDGAQICVTASTEGYYVNKVQQWLFTRRNLMHCVRYWIFDKTTCISTLMYEWMWCCVLQGMKVNGEVDPERVGGQVYPNLVTLLKNSSQHFSTNIGKQVCTFYTVLPLLSPFHVYNTCRLHIVL